MNLIYRFLILLALVLSPLLMVGQQKTILVEHFTNTRCPICKQNNPAFYDLYNQFKQQAIHIAYHPSVPYSSCVFYQANTAGNGIRQAWYNIIGTPTAFINGKKGSGNLPTREDYIAAGQEVALLDLAFEECTPTNVTIKITALVDFPFPATYRVYAALTEKHIMYAAPNGETQHWDVFRKFLNDVNSGLELTIPELTKAGDVLFLHLGSIDYPGMWEVGDFNVIAFAQEAAGYDIVQAVKGEISPAASSFKVEPKVIQINTAPNPASDALEISWDIQSEFRPSAVKVFNAAGVEMALGQVDSGSSGIRVDIRNLQPGKYYIHIIDLSGKQTGQARFIKK